MKKKQTRLPISPEEFYKRYWTVLKPQVPADNKHSSLHPSINIYGVAGTMTKTEMEYLHGVVKSNVQIDKIYKKNK